jgi:hypothetical protein
MILFTQVPDFSQLFGCIFRTKPDMEEQKNKLHGLGRRLVTLTPMKTAPIMKISGGGSAGCVRFHDRWPARDRLTQWEATMAEFNVQGAWTAIQDNNFNANFDIFPPRPDGSFIVRANQPSGVLGTGFGFVRDDQFVARIVWTNNTEGAYNGIFDSEGRLIGSTFDVQHPSSFTGWHSNRTFSRT